MKKNLKKIASLLAIVMTIVSLGLVSAVAEDTSGAVIEEFNNSAAITGVEYSTTEAYEDSRSLHINSTKDMAISAKWSTFNLVSGEEYDISFYFKGTIGTMYIRFGWGYTGNSLVISSNAVGSGGGGDYATVGEADENGWRQFTATMTASTSDTEMFRIKNTNDFYMDNLSIKDSDGNEMIENGGFEEVIVEPNTDIITEFGNTAVIEGLSYSDTVGYDGSSSIHVNTDTKTTLATTAGLSLGSGKKYNFEFYIKGDLTSDNGLYVRTGWNSYAQNMAQLKSANGVITAAQGTNIKVEDAGNGWYKVSSVKAWPCTASLQFLEITNGNVDFYIDNFSITEQQDIVTELGNTSYIAGLSYDEFTGFDDEKSIKVAATAQTDIAKVASLGLENGKYYNFSFYIKGLITSTNGMYVGTGWSYSANYIKLKSDADGVFSVAEGVGAELVTITDAGNGWYKVEAKEPWKCTDATMNFMRVTTAGGTASFNIDNFEISETEILDIPRGDVITEIGNTEAVAGLAYSTAEAKEGASSLNINIAAESDITTPAKLGMKAGESYSFSFYIKGKVTSSNGMYIRTGWSSYDSDMAKLKSDANGVFSIAGGTNLTVTEAEDGWYKVASINPWPVSDAGIGFMRITVAGAPTGEPNFYIDNLSITDANGNELITNGSFEAPAYQTTDFEIVDNGSGNYTVNVLVKNNSAGSDFTAHLILATHKDKVMQNISMSETAVEVAPGKTLRISQNITVAEGETLTAFLWDSVLGMTPLANSDVLITAE